MNNRGRTVISRFQLELAPLGRYRCTLFSHIFRISHFLMFCLCKLVHILTLHVLSFQNPIYCYPYYSFVYNVGFYFTEYKLVCPSSQSSSKLHYTHSHPIIIPSYSLRTIIKVLVLVVLHNFLSFLAVSHYHCISTFSRSRLRRTGDPALYPHCTVHCVSVYR